MSNIILPGNRHGWVETGINLQANEWLLCKAGGEIDFGGNGGQRNPEGADADGGFIDADDSHPAPELRKNSLAIDVGGHRVQGGTVVAARCPYKGRVYISQNDNQSSDNDGHWWIDLRRWRPDPKSISRVVMQYEGERTRVTVEGKFRSLPTGYAPRVMMKENRHDPHNNSLTFFVLGGVQVVLEKTMEAKKDHDFRYVHTFDLVLPRDMKFYFNTYSGPVEVPADVVEVR